MNDKLTLNQIKDIISKYKLTKEDHDLISLYSYNNISAMWTEDKVDVEYGYLYLAIQLSDFNETHLTYHVLVEPNEDMLRQESNVKAYRLINDIIFSDFYGMDSYIDKYKKIPKDYLDQQVIDTFNLMMENKLKIGDLKKETTKSVYSLKKHLQDEYEIILNGKRS